jgi:ElaB/YqjD/DUF883 family membrane-anchored ribosome-binding protein
MAPPVNRLESLWSRSESREAPVLDEPPFSMRRVKLRAKSWENGVEGLMAKHPTAAIVAAAAIGIALGWMVKRK